MANRTKILIVESNLDVLSRIYLALVHRHYKAEASDREQEIMERIKRMKPAVVVLGHKEFLSLKQELKMPVVVLLEPEAMAQFPAREDLVPVPHPVQIEALIHTIEGLVI